MPKDMNYTVPTGLVLNQHTGMIVFDPMTGGRHFTTSSWVMWNRSGGNIRLTGEMCPLTETEVRKFCDMNRTHHFWWQRVATGAILFARPYSCSVVGERLLYPEEETHSEKLKRQRGGRTHHAIGGALV